MQAEHLRIVQLLSRLVTCEDCCPSCRAGAIELLEGPDAIALEHCPLCGFPKLRDVACPCEQYIGQPANLASERFKQAS